MVDWNNKEEVLEAVKVHGCVFQYASEQLRNDREIVIEAIKQFYWELEYASEQLKNNRKFMMEAVKENGLVLEYASEQLKNDPKLKYIASLDWKRWNRIFNKMIIFNLFIKLFEKDIVYHIIKYY